MAQRSALDTMVPLSEWSLRNRIVQAAFGLIFYPWKTLWPSGLTPLRELPATVHAFESPYVLCEIILIVAIAAIALLRRRQPGLATAALIYAVLIAPVLGFAQSGPQLVADKYSYVSCISGAVLAAGAMLTASRAWKSAAASLFVAALIALVALSMRTRDLIQTWHDSRSLWAHALAVDPPSSVAHLNTGVLLRGEGRVEEALSHYRDALKLRPNNGEAWYALGNASKQLKRFDEAERAYREAVKTMTQRHLAWLNLGNMYLRDLNRPADAVDAYRAAIAHMERFHSKMFTPTPYLALGIALRMTGDPAGARAALQVAARYAETRDLARAQLRQLPGPAGAAGNGVSR
jgi:tetratricopeptide (TPR) repeat protein